MKRFWTGGRTRFALAAAAAAVTVGIAASIGAAAYGDFSTNPVTQAAKTAAASGGAIANAAEELVSPSGSSAVEQQYPPGKTTICHRTHSKKHPYVMITVSNRSLPAHRKHGDIIPAPSGGCPTAASAAKTKKAKHAGKADKANKAGKGKKAKAPKAAGAQQSKANAQKTKKPKSTHGNAQHSKSRHTKAHGKGKSANTAPRGGAPTQAGAGKPANPGRGQGGQDHQQHGNSGQGNGGQVHGKRK
jgi:hypothetical protein